MKIEEILKKSPKSRKYKKRVGRGIGSGTGKTSGRGHKGQKSRAGSKAKAGFEGGQMPLIRRVPKRGFTNSFSKQYQIVNVEKLEVFKEGQIVTPEELKKQGIIKKSSLPIKILGSGEIKKNIILKVHKISKTAREKIEKAGGKIEIILKNKN